MSRSRVAAVPAAGFVWLASQSPRRRQLLEQIGVAYELLVAGADADAGADEDADALEALEAERRGETPLAYVERVTLAKLGAARRRLARRGAAAAAPILCADTTVALGARILGKPADAVDAARMLALLAGRTHRVLTAVAVASGPTTRRATSVSRVRFAPLSARQIDAYVASGEPFGKAGAYAIQGRAGAFVDAVAGSYTGIMGLPLHETAVLLRRAGVRIV